MTAQPYRLAAGGRIDRNRICNFHFDGRALSGFHGDTLASALLANGIRVVARSFKYHRPRGILSAGVEEPNGLVETGDGSHHNPSCRATLVTLFDGLTARSQNCWPTAHFDLGRALDFSRLLWPVGFYNKTFKWPGWRWYEWAIRRTAGLGRAPTEPDPDRYEQMNAHCDVLICGGGAAGLMATLTAARAGLRAILVDLGETPGGSLLWERCQIDDRPGEAWVAKVLAELEVSPNVTVLPRTFVTGIYDHNVTALVERGRPDREGFSHCYWTVRPKSIVVATGAIEQPLLFTHNDRPGVMLAGATRHYLNRYAVAAGRRVVIATNNDTAYQTAFDLQRAGIEVAAVIDGRASVNETLTGQARQGGARVLTGHRIDDTSGGRGIRSVTVRAHGGGAREKLRCDLLAASGGWAPTVHLLCHAGGTLRFDERLQAFLPDETPKGMRVVGAAAGEFSLDGCLIQARQAMEAIVREFGKKTPAPPAYAVETRNTSNAASGGSAPLHGKPARIWLDYQHDVTLKDAEIAVRENYVSVEHFKRYTTSGMSVDQGKTSNLNAFVTLAGLTGEPVGNIGTTTFRPPYSPVAFGAIAAGRQGDFYAPKRLLPAHQLHLRLTQAFEDVAGWQRPVCYPRDGENEKQAISREAGAVRRTVGVFDNSPLGKIEVKGEHATAFLDRLYINDVPGLEIGRARYGLMLNENGVIIDDGVFIRMAADHYLINTTSGGAARITDWMEEWLQCEWRNLHVMVADVTTQWANFTIAGPRARSLVQALGTGLDLSPESFPHMTFKAASIAEVPIRVVRVSFSGELSYEINVAADYGEDLMKNILDAGAEYGITPYGLEALMVLRTEKGYLHVGSDTDGTTSPDDVGWGEVARKKTTDFIGKRSLSRPENERRDRFQLVGLRPVTPGTQIPVGAHLLVGRNRKPPALTNGWVTSACLSPALGDWVALGMLRSGRAEHGKHITVCDGNRTIAAKVVPPAFVDPGGERLHA